MKPSRRPSSSGQARELAELRIRLAEAEQTLGAIHRGEVDALVVAGKQGRRVFTLQGAEHAYRELIESMNEGALTMTAGAVILYANRRFGEMVQLPLEKVIGRSFFDLLDHGGRAAIRPCLKSNHPAGSSRRLRLTVSDGSKLPVRISLRRLPKNGAKHAPHGMVVTDMTQAEQTEQRLQTEREQALLNLKMFRSLADHSPEFIRLCDAEFKAFYVNEAGRRLVGLGSAETACAVMARDFFFPEDQHLMREEFLAKVRRERVAEVEIRYRHFKTGAPLWMIETTFQLLDGQGRVNGYATVSRDITKRRQLEQDKAEALRLLDTLLTHAPVGFAFFDRDLRFVRVNERLAAFNGYSAAAHLGRPIAEILPAMAPALQELAAHILATGQPALDHEFTGETARAPGLARCWNASWYPVHDERGEIIGFGAVVEELTERKKAEAALRNSEAQLREQLTRLALLEQITRAISTNLDFRHILEVVTTNLEDNLPVDFCCVCLFDEQTKRCEVAQVGPKSTPLALELAMPEHAVIALDCDALAQAARGEFSYLPDVRVMAFPFPQRLAQAGLRALVLAPLLLDGKVIGFLLVARREVCSFFAGDREFMQQLSEHVALAYQQAKLHLSLQMAYDALRQTQEAAVQRERLRALGQMVSGITHDINNAISPVTLYTASLLEHEPDLSERARDYLQTIHQSVQNVAETIARLRDFYRAHEPQVILTRTHLNHLAQQALDLTRVRWSDSPQQRGIVIQAQLRLAEDLPEIMGVEGEIRDAIINLIFNALDAMPRGGVLTLRSLAKPSAAGTGATPDAREACLEVIDTGTGMDDDTRRRCLEPFFTTKGEHGTGLGLAMVYGMIKRHSAKIEILSASGQGTTVRMIFPVTAAASTRVSAQPWALIPEPANQRILYIDDDPRLIKSMRDTLENDGHTVVTATGGQEGIHAFIHAQERNEAFTVVITDLGMPHVDGRKVASSVKAASPSTPVILLTGWGQTLKAEGEIPAQVDRLLCKPPNLRELREALATCCPPEQSKATKT